MTLSSAWMPLMSMCSDALHAEQEKALARILGQVALDALLDVVRSPKIEIAQDFDDPQLRTGWLIRLMDQVLEAIIGKHRAHARRARPQQIVREGHEDSGEYSELQRQKEGCSQGHNHDDAIAAGATPDARHLVAVDETDGCDDQHSGQRAQGDVAGQRCETPAWRQG